MLDSVGWIPFSAFYIHCEFAPHPSCEWNYRSVQFGGYEKRHHMVVSCTVASNAIVHCPCGVPFLKSTLFPTEGCRKPCSIRLLSPSLAELQVHRVFSPDSPLLVAHKLIGQGGNMLCTLLWALTKQKLHLLKSLELPYCSHSGSAQIRGLSKDTRGCLMLSWLVPKKSQSMEKQKAKQPKYGCWFWRSVAEISLIPTASEWINA